MKTEDTIALSAVAVRSSNRQDWDKLVEAISRLSADYDTAAIQSATTESMPVVVGGARSLRHLLKILTNAPQTAEALALARKNT